MQNIGWPTESKYARLAVVVRRVTGHLVFLLVGIAPASFWSVLTDSHKKSFCSVALEINGTVIVLCIFSVI